MTMPRRYAEPDTRRALVAYIRGSDNPDLRAYVGGLADELEKPGGAARFFWLIRQFATLGHIRPGDRVLDIGCGFGHQPVALAMLAGCRVAANDIRESMTRPLAERVAALRATGLDIAVEPLTGDICDLDIPPASFDAMICNQTIEHVHDLARMFRACFAALRPGGRIVITNDNNALNRAALAEAGAMWRRRDSSWEYIEELKRERPIENAGIEPYGVMRERIVRGANPALGADALARVVAASAGLRESEIADLARRYTPAATLPTPPRHAWCRNPVTGEYCDRQLDPTEVLGLLRAAGFRTRLRHGFRQWPLSWLNGVRLRPLNLWLFNLRAYFILVAERPV